MITELSWPTVAAAVMLVAVAPVSAQLANPAARMTLKGNHPALTEHLSVSGRAAPQMPLAMHITLALHDRAQLNQLVLDQQDPASPHYHQWLTRQQFDARFGPSQAQADAVSSWLAGQGFQVTAASATKRSITFNGTAKQAEQAFQTHLGMFASGHTFANVSDPVIPRPSQAWSCISAALITYIRSPR